MNELAGVGGYASLMRTQKNPYERNIATTSSILSTMPQGGGVTGLERLGAIPLMYAMGRDTANAQAFDSQQMAKEDQQMQGIMAYQQARDQEKMKLEQDKAVSEDNARKAKVLAKTMDTAKKLTESGNQGEAVKLLNSIGIPATSFNVTPSGNQIQMKNGSFWMPIQDEGGKTVPGVWDTEASKWRPATEDDSSALMKPETPPKLTGHLVRDPQSKTGYSYAGDNGEIMTRNAPTPAELHPRPAPAEKPPVDPLKSLKFVLPAGSNKYLTFDITNPEAAAGYKSYMQQGGRDVTAEVATANVTEGRAVANNANPKPGKVGGMSALLAGSSTAPKPAASTGQPDLATAQKLIAKYGSPDAARAAWARGER